MKTVIIRTLGGKEIGYGHLYRCLSLAKALILSEEEIEIIFLVNDELVDFIKNTSFNFLISNNLNKDIDVVYQIDVSLFIFDSYLGNDEYLRNIKKKTKLMLIDDNNDIYDSTIPDIIYNGNIFVEDLGYPYVDGQIQLLGSKYLIMREEYWDNSDGEDIDNQMILITTGGTDEYGISVKIINEIKALDANICVIIGPGYREDYIKIIERNKTENIKLIFKPNSLKKYINHSKIVITAGGSTVYEVLSQNKTPIVYSIADNQDFICYTLNKMGVEYIGKHPNIEYYSLVKLIKEIFDNKTMDNVYISNRITGKGVFLVVKSVICALGE